MNETEAKLANAALQDYAAAVAVAVANAGRKPSYGNVTGAYGRLILLHQKAIAEYPDIRAACCCVYGSAVAALHALATDDDARALLIADPCMGSARTEAA